MKLRTQPRFHANIMSIGSPMKRIAREQETLAQHAAPENTLAPPALMRPRARPLPPSFTGAFPGLSPTCEEAGLAMPVSPLPSGARIAGLHRPYVGEFSSARRSDALGRRTARGLGAPGRGVEQPALASPAAHLPRSIFPLISSCVAGSVGLPSGGSPARSGSRWAWLASALPHQRWLDCLDDGMGSGRCKPLLGRGGGVTSPAHPSRGRRRTRPPTPCGTSGCPSWS